MGKTGKKKQRQSPHVIGALAERCAALGCAPRLAIVAHLAASGPTSVNDLGEVAGISVSGVSQHLVKLRAAGAVVGRRQAQTIRYELVPGWIEGLMVEMGKLAGPSRVEIESRNPILLGTAELIPVKKVGTAGKRRNTRSARPDATRSDDQGSGKGEVATEAADAQESRPDAELVDLDDIVGIDSSVMEAGEHDENGGSGTRFIDAPEADEVYPEEAGGTGLDPDGAPAYSPGPSYGGAR